MSRKGPKPLGRVPIAALLEATGLDNLGQLADALGVNHGLLYANTDEAGAITWTLADRWASHMGLHPINVWGEAWEKAADGDNEEACA